MNRQQLTAMYDFTGKTFAVTGGGGALGGDVVTVLANCGANVMILDRNLARLADLKACLEPGAGELDGVQVDVMNRDSLTAAGEAINKRFGPLFGLVNAAGGNSPRATVNP